MTDSIESAWLRPIPAEIATEFYTLCLGNIVAAGGSEVIRTALDELAEAAKAVTGKSPVISDTPRGQSYIAIGTINKLNPYIINVINENDRATISHDGYVIKSSSDAGGNVVALLGGSERGVLYGVFHLLRLLGGAHPTLLDKPLHIIENPYSPLRMLNQWDNADGSIERGYAGKSIFYKHGKVVSDLTRVGKYARMLASVGINSIAVNNVNVHDEETGFISGNGLQGMARLASVFRSYGIRMFISINFSSPISLGGLHTADPLDTQVRSWWRVIAADVYRVIPDLGGFLVKADSEYRPGPHTYGRNHADGANMLAEALEPFGGIVLWRCFVYNCMQDWRDRSIDRAKAAYEHFMPLDGKFHDNVILQIKNGPMDFQVREPVSPLFGAMTSTNQMLEVQLTQEYTGQQRHLCYLVPQWKEALDFDTHWGDEGSGKLKSIVAGRRYPMEYSGMTGVSNIGSDACWTGHPLAQANLYGFGRLAWNPDLSSAAIAEEWIRLTFGNEVQTVDIIQRMLLSSWRTYENYTAPLGVGWMVTPGSHYGPDVDGYEYSHWGTYHYADKNGIGVDRTVKTGTGYTAQYHPINRDVYDSLERCPDDLLLFFHHVSYTHKLQSGKTVIQHIYDTHFAGAEEAEALLQQWRLLKDVLEKNVYRLVEERLQEQAAHAVHWRDTINSYFFSKSGIADLNGRTIPKEPFSLRKKSRKFIATFMFSAKKRWMKRLRVSEAAAAGAGGASALTQNREED